MELGHLAAEHFAERPEPTRGARDRTPSYAVAPSAASDTSRAVDSQVRFTQKKRKLGAKHGVIYVGNVGRTATPARRLGSPKPPRDD